MQSGLTRVDRKARDASNVIARMPSLSQSISPSKAQAKPRRAEQLHCDLVLTANETSESPGKLRVDYSTVHSKPGVYRFAVRFSLLLARHICFFPPPHDPLIALSFAAYFSVSKQIILILTATQRGSNHLDPIAPQKRANLIRLCVWSFAVCRQEYVSTEDPIRFPLCPLLCCSTPFSSSFRARPGSFFLTITIISVLARQPSSPPPLLPSLSRAQASLTRWSRA